MENTVWILFVDRNVAKKGEKDFLGEKKELRAFTKFEEAVRAMRTVIHDLAFTDNVLFDGKGHIRGFEKYIECDVATIADYEDFENCFTKPLRTISEKMQLYFASQEDYSEMSQLEGLDWEDWLCNCKCKVINGHPLLTIDGICEGPCTHINPDIYINSFVMDDPEITNYVCHIRDPFDYFWYDETPHYVHIELQKTNLE